MGFRHLVRHSKALTLPSEAVKKSLGPNVPQEQVLATTAASFHRRNWGLKSNVPKKAQSHELSVGKLDNERGMAEVDYNPRFARKIQRIEEIGCHLSGDSSLSSPVKPTVRSVTAADLSPKQLKRLEKKASRMRQSFLDKYPSRADRNVANVESFLGLGSINSVVMGGSSLSSARGLTYASPQVYFNVPGQGVVEKKTVRGRPIMQGQTRRVAISGFLAYTSAGETTPLPGDDVLHQTPRDYHVNVVTSNGNGNVQMQVQPATPAQTARKTASLDDIIKV